MKTINFIFCIIGLQLITGCATIFTGTTQKIYIDSTPQGAEIIVDGKKEGQTPSRIEIDKDVNDFIDGGKDIILELEGYENHGYEIDAELNPVAILNLFNVVCWGIDAVTGAIVKYDNTNNFELIPVEKPKPVDNNTSEKYNKLKELKKLLDEGILTQEEFEKEKTKILNDE